MSRVDWTETERLLYKGALRCNLALASDWYSDKSLFLDPNFDAQELFVELLLLLPRNLRKIEIEVRTDWRFQRLETPADVSRPPPCLPALRVLSITSATQGYRPFRFRVTDVQPIMRIAPLLHTFVTTFCAYSPDLPCPGIAHVKNLYLFGSAISRGRLEEIIAAHSRLESYYQAFMDHPHSYRTPRWWEVIGVLRRYHAKSLRKLGVDLAQGKSRRMGNPQPPDDGLSMKEFTNLESLHIYNYKPGRFRRLELPKPSELVNLLPQENLKQLYFYTYILGPVFIHVLKALASAIEFEGQFPCLKEIHIRPDDIAEHDYVPDFDIRADEDKDLSWEAIGEMAGALQARFAHLGVELLIH